MDDVKVRVATAKQSTATVMDVLLPRDRKGRGWVCPFCGNGNGEDGDGLKLVPPYRQRVHCFRCGWGGDILDVAAAALGLKTFREKLEAVEALAGCSLSPRTTPARTTRRTRDYAEFFREAHGHVHETDYFQRRGLSTETIERYKLGFALQRVDGKNWDAAIIPTSAHSYTVRNTDPDADHGNRYRKVGPTCVFNVAAMYKKAPCWITEGEINALSLLELGATAAALGSSADWQKLIREIDSKRPTESLILCLDNDKAGCEAGARLAAALAAREIDFRLVDICRPGMDINDELVSDRDGLKEKVSKLENEPEV